MSIREDLVASAAKFLQDPSVASSPLEKRIAFLQAKNLTQEEVGAALARAGPEAAPTSPPQQYAPPPGSAPAGQQQPPYYAQYPPQYPPYAWQPPHQEAPRRDWRDWFIMATVVSGVSYGLYTLGKRYVFPLIAPPTPDRLEQDKKSIDEQFERAFGLVEQLAKDTEALKAAERERTERLDSVLGELETVLGDLKTANRRRDDEMGRVREEVQGLQSAVPRALESQKEMADTRMREVNLELKSLKTLISQRMNPTATSTSVGGYLRPTSDFAAPISPPVYKAAGASASENADGVNGSWKPASTVDDSVSKAQEYAAPTSSSTFGRSSPFASGMATGGAKASIPAWQLAMSKGAASSSATAAAAATNGDAGGSDGEEAAAGSS